MNKLLGGVLALALMVGNVSSLGVPGFLKTAGSYAAVPFKGMANHHKKTVAVIGAIAAAAAWQSKSHLKEMENEESAVKRSLAIPGLNRVPALRKFVGVKLGKTGMTRVFYVATAVAAACALYLAKEGAVNGKQMWSDKRAELQPLQTAWNAFIESSTAYDKAEKAHNLAEGVKAAEVRTAQQEWDASGASDKGACPADYVAQDFTFATTRGTEPTDAQPNVLQRTFFWLDTKTTVTS